MNTIFSIPDNKEHFEQVTSKKVSLNSLSNQQALDYTKISSKIQSTVYSVDNLIYLFNKLKKSVLTLTWAVKEMIALENVYLAHYVVRATQNSYGGIVKHYYYPDAWIWNAVYEKYKPFIKGAI